MALSVGTRLGSYEVIAQVGAGGMGDVYRARDTKLFYRNGRQMMAVTMVPGPTLSVGTPRLLFEGNYSQEEPGQGANNHDVSADVQRFVLMKDAAQPAQADAPPPQIIVIQNWSEELKRLVPTK